MTENETKIVTPGKKIDSDKTKPVKELPMPHKNKYKFENKGVAENAPVVRAPIKIPIALRDHNQEKNIHAEESTSKLPKKRRKRSHEPKSEDGVAHLTSPEERILRRKIRQIGKVASVIVQKNPETKKLKMHHVVGFSSVFPLCAPFINMWKANDNNKHRKLLLRCLKGLKNKLMREIHALSLSSSSANHDTVKATDEAKCVDIQHV